MNKKRFLASIALAVIACALIIPLVAAATYGISSDVVATNYPPSGSVTNKDNIKGSSPDLSYARIYGITTYGSGGSIQGNLGTNVPSTSKIEINAYPATGYTSRVRVYVSSDGSTWNPVGYVDVNGGPTWWTVGYAYQTVRYVAVASIYEDSKQPNVYIDCVRVTQPP